MIEVVCRSRFTGEEIARKAVATYEQAVKLETEWMLALLSPPIPSVVIGGERIGILGWSLEIEGLEPPATVTASA